MAKLVLGNDKSIVIPALVKVVEVPVVGPYPLLSRVTDDSNNEIGTVCGYHTDANNQKYAVVCLDAQYRNSSGQYLEYNMSISNLPSYTNNSVYGAKETATFNSDKILATATSVGITTTAVSHCRAQTFVISGDSYNGQLPTLTELLEILEWKSEINAADTTAASNPTLIVPNNKDLLSSNQYSSVDCWYINSLGIPGPNAKRNDDLLIIPVLEIPIN